MSEIVFAIPGDIDLPTGGYGYDRRLLREWHANGVAAQHLALPGSFPNPTPTDLDETGRLLLSQPFNRVLLIDGLAYGAFPESIAADLAGRVVALVHHPLGFETGLGTEQARALIARETAALRYASAIIVTSPATKRLLVSEFGVPAERIAVAEPGVDRAPRAAGGRPGEPLQLLAVGSLVPRKGYDILVEALRPLRDVSWQLTIIGAADRAPATTLALKAQIASSGLQDRIMLAGAVGEVELAHAYDKAELFVMPSLFEGYGMVLTEAMARGLPILCTTGGAAAETVPDAAAIKVAPGDAGALTRALSELLAVPPGRKRLADASWAAAETLPRWHDTATIVAETCRKVFA